jgi:hypothetical protein
MKFRILAGILVLAFLSVPAVTADGIPPPVTVAVSGSVPTLVCTFTVSPTSLSFGNNMIPGKTYTTPSGTASITCNYPWTIGVSDSSGGNGKKAKPAGYLWNTTDSVNLTQPFQLSVPGAALSINLLTPGTFISSSPGTFNYGFTFSQAITGADGPDLYNTTVTFTLSLT